MKKVLFLALMSAYSFVGSAATTQTVSLDNILKNIEEFRSFSSSGFQGVNNNGYITMFIPYNDNKVLDMGKRTQSTYVDQISYSIAGDRKCAYHIRLTTSELGYNLQLMPENSTKLHWLSDVARINATMFFTVEFKELLKECIEYNFDNISEIQLNFK